MKNIHIFKYALTVFELVIRKHAIIELLYRFWYIKIMIVIYLFIYLFRDINEEEPPRKMTKKETFG